MTAERLESRTELLGYLDQTRRDADQTGQMEALDSYTQRAVDVVTSGSVADALDLNKEHRINNESSRSWISPETFVQFCRTLVFIVMDQMNIRVKLIYGLISKRERLQNGTEFFRLYPDIPK